MEAHYARWDVIFDRYIPDRKKVKTTTAAKQADAAEYEDEDEPLF